MPSIAAVTKIELPYKVEQQKVKDYALDLFSKDFPLVQKLSGIFDNTEIISRNLCKPLNTYADSKSFEDNNKDYIRFALQYAVEAIEACLATTNIKKEAVTDIIFISSTGLSTPSLDALIVNQMKLNAHINRMGIFGLGCAGGVSGVAKACALAKGNPDAVVLLVAVELCSLTFLRNDYSKSNFVASSLFSDGIAATIILGDNHAPQQQVTFVASGSKLYYDTLDVMGWEFLDTGFKVLFSQDIPTIIRQYVKDDVVSFLAKNGLELSDIKNFIFHPGGKKVLTAYAEAFDMEADFLKITRETMNSHGNMSSATVLYVLQQFMEKGFENGYGLMVAMGPGFSSEMVLLNMTKK